MPINADARDVPGTGAPDKATEISTGRPAGRPTAVQRRWLQGGLSQPGGKLPLFDSDGQRVAASTVRSCLRQGWAEPWFSNPLKPDWIVCKLTHLGRVVAEEDLWDTAG